MNHENQAMAENLRNIVSQQVAKEMEHHYAYLKDMEEAIQRRAMKLSTDSTGYMSKAQTSCKKGRSYRDLCSDVKVTQHTDKSEGTSKGVDKFYSNLMSNGNQLLSHDSSYPDGDITITHFKTNFAKEKLPNFNDVSNVERNSEKAVTAGR